MLNILSVALFAGAAYTANTDELDKTVVLMLACIFVTLQSIHGKIGENK